MPSSITCLGKSFTSEDERRSYFRDELQQKLPELRKIEGFPVGTDEDILNLSDPPYYTACPNPWLNDFIAQWEVEKNVLELNKKRKANFVVSEPYASDVSEGKNNPIYNAHTYHTKVPHPAIMRYILHYTQPGDVVFDGFAGTGMTGVAANVCGKPDAEMKFRIDEEWKKLFGNIPLWGTRKAICSDLSPIASFIAYNYNTTVNITDYEVEVNRILKEVEVECNWMYETLHANGQKGKINYVLWSDVLICPNCGNEIVYWDAAVDKNAGGVSENFNCPNCRAKQTKKSTNKAKQTIYDYALEETISQTKTVPVLINYNYGGKRFEKKPDELDLSLVKKIDEMKSLHWFPKDRMPKGDESRRNDRDGITHVHHFYTKRNLLILAAIWSRLTIKMKWAATSFLSRNLTKTNRFVINKHNPNGRINGPLTGTLYIPSEYVEQSAISLFKDKFLKSGWSNTGNCIQTSSASCLSNVLDNSVDYIFTDPPFGANIMYSELNFLWESWLKVKTNNKLEAIENKTQNKTVIDYQDIMTICFKEYFRILKSGKWMTVEFSNTSAAVWNGIQTALQRAGFVIANVSALDKQHGGIRAMHYTTAVKQDLIISCYKPTNDFDDKFHRESSDVNIWTFVEEHLNHLPISMIKEKTSTAIIERSPKILYDRLISFYLMRGLPIPIDAAEFQVKLKLKFKESDGMIFTDEQRAQYEDQKQKQGITQQLSLVFDIIYSESDAVDWMKVRLAKSPQKYNEIQPDFRKANTATRKGEKEFELQTLLNENFIPMNDGRWRAPDMNEAKDREHFRTATLLKEFSRYLEELANSKGKLLKDVRVEALREGFKSLWQKKDFNTILNVAEKIPPNLLMEDEQLLMFYDIAKDRV